jgi:hypothetical protein
MGHAKHAHALRSFTLRRIKRKSANVTMLKHKVAAPPGKDGEWYRRQWLCPKCMKAALATILPEDVIPRKPRKSVSV